MSAPRLPGVYVIRSRGEVVYVGMAGERSGNGLMGRLARYHSGKAAASGFGEAALDRALADAVFVRCRLAELESGRTLRAVGWAKAAIAACEPELSWTVTPDRETALVLETAVVDGLRSAGVTLWNR